MTPRSLPRSILLSSISIACVVVSACAPLIPIKAPSTDLPLPSVQTVIAPTATHITDAISEEQISGTQITLWHGLEGEYAKSLQALAAEWNITNSNKIQVDVIGYENMRALETALAADSGQTRPQMAVVLPSQMTDLSDVLIELTPYMRDARVGFGSEEFLPVMPPLALDSDQIVSIPFAKSVRVVVVNSDFATEVDIEKPPQSVDEFIDQACKGNQFWRLDEDPANDGLGGWALDTNVNWQTPSSLILAAEPDNNSIPANLSLPEISALFLKLYQMREFGCSWLPEQGTEQQQFAERKALFVTVDLQQVGTLRSEMTTRNNSDRLSALAYPGVTPALIPYGPDIVVLRSTPQQQLAAWLFIRWLLQDAQQQTWAQQTGLLPVTQSGMVNSQPVGQDLLVKQIWELVLTQNASPKGTTAKGEKENWIIGDGYYSFNRYFPYYGSNELIEDLISHIEELTK